jgi:nitroimidazol reductase NimA-like FMN-containing flavoprotein (pyridoxamine 5'-phosphate oxidase superfamily)
MAGVRHGAGTPTPRTRVRRQPARGAYDRETIDAILDAALVCHLGFVADGLPVVIPSLHARVGDALFVHGSAASRTVRALGSGVPVCVTVTLLDGLVLARSVFEHSVNYRSVVVFGNARLVEDPHEKLAGLRALTEQLLPGRWDDVRAPSRQELKATSLLVLPIEEASAKLRDGGPSDGEGPDGALDVWAGEIPLVLAAGTPVADPALAPGVVMPDYVRHFHRPGLVRGRDDADGGARGEGGGRAGGEGGGRAGGEGGGRAGGEGGGRAGEPPDVA